MTDTPAETPAPEQPTDDAPAPTVRVPNVTPNAVSGLDHSPLYGDVDPAADTAPTDPDDAEPAPQPDGTVDPDQQGPDTQPIPTVTEGTQEPGTETGQDGTQGTDPAPTPTATPDGAQEPPRGGDTPPETPTN